MGKFVRGPFTTIDEVKEALNHLHNEGYSSKDVTVVANHKQDLDALKSSTSADISKEDGDHLNDTENQSYWNELSDQFSGFFFNSHLTGTPDSPIVGYVPTPNRMADTELLNEQHVIEDEDPTELLATFKDDLEDGKIVILVEDTKNIDTKFNLDAIDDYKDTLIVEDEGEVNADPSEVMNETVTERDSHPDIDNDEEVLEQETTYVPTDSVDDEETNRNHPTL